MVYNYKSDETVQTMIFESTFELLTDIINEYNSLKRYCDLTIYAPAYICKELFDNLFNGDMYIDALYEDEYYELLACEDNELAFTINCDGELFIEEARFDSGQLKLSESSLVYFYDGFLRKDLDWISANEDSILVFGFFDEQLILPMK